MSVDPLTKDYPWYTPYQFAGNKPIKCSDVDGAEENDKSTYVYRPKPVITKFDASTIYRLKQEKLHMMVNDYAKTLLETKGIKIDASALFNSFVKILEKADAAVSGNGVYVKGGLEQIAPTNGGPGTKTKTTNRDVKTINIDLFIAAASTMFKSPMKMGDSNPLNPASAIVDIGGVAQEVADKVKKEEKPRNFGDTTVETNYWNPNGSNTKFYTKDVDGHTVGPANAKDKEQYDQPSKLNANDL